MAVSVVRHVVGIAVIVLSAGCATRGPMHLYLAGADGAPIIDRDLEGDNHDALPGFLQEDETVVGLGYEYNTDYIWLRLAPGDTLLAIKRSVRQEWYRYTLPPEFAASGATSLDLAVRAFDRMVYAALPEPGRVGKITRYGKVLPAIRPGETARAIGGLAWDQVNDRLLVLFADDGSVVAHADEVRPVATVRFEAAVAPTSLAFDSNRQRYYVPLRDEPNLGEFDADGRLIERIPLPAPRQAIDAGQRSAVRVF